jgi:hypothetical protein
MYTINMSRLICILCEGAIINLRKFYLQKLTVALEEIPYFIPNNMDTCN